MTQISNQFGPQIHAFIISFVTCISFQIIKPEQVAKGGPLCIADCCQKNLLAILDREYIIDSPR